MSEAFPSADPELVKQRLEELSLQMELAIDHDNNARFELAASRMEALLEQHHGIIDELARTRE